jgi:hypothetical protein
VYSPTAFWRDAEDGITLGAHRFDDSTFPWLPVVNLAPMKLVPA